MPYFHRSFLQKSPIISGSFAKNDLQLKASYDATPPCNVSQATHNITRWHKVIEWLIFIGYFLQNSPIISKCIACVMSSCVMPPHATTHLVWWHQRYQSKDRTRNASTFEYLHTLQVLFSVSGKYFRVFPSSVCFECFLRVFLSKVSVECFLWVFASSVSIDCFLWVVALSISSECFLRLFSSTVCFECFILLRLLRVLHLVIYHTSSPTKHPHPPPHILIPHHTPHPPPHILTRYASSSSESDESKVEGSLAYWR